MFQNKVKTLLVAVSIIAITAWALYPVFLSDGVNNFSGDAQQAARAALDDVNKAMSTGKESIGNIGVLKRRIAVVNKEDTPASGVFSKCHSFYKVTIEDVGFFGKRSVAGDRPVCL